MPDLIDNDGRTVAVSDENVANALSQGWRPATTADSIKRADEAAQHEAYGGIAGGAKALFYGGLRGATLGLSDVGLRALGTSGAELKGYQEENPGLSTGAELAGAFAPALASGGASIAGRLGAKGTTSVLGGLGAEGGLLASTPAGLVSHIGRSIVDAAERGGAGVVGKAVAGTAGAAAEGALYGGGSYLSQTAIEDKPLAAEGFLGAMGKGALWAAPVGGALSLGESALIKARSLFPKAEMTKDVARSLDRDATSAISQSMQDGQQMADKARQQIALTEAKIGSSQATEQMTRSMFGAADDASLQNQVTGAAEHGELSRALQNYETSNARFEDWIRAEADPDLERSLLRLRSPNVQDASAPKLNVPEWGEVVPPQRGFEAVGTPGPHEPPRVPITTDLPPLPLSQDLTRMIKPGEDGLTFDPVSRSYFKGEAPVTGASPPREPGFVKTDRPAGGSQGGSWYEDEHGQQWFGKHYGGNTDRLAGEHVANEIYRTFGVAAPETKLVDVGGKQMLMSSEIAGRHPDTTAVLNQSDVHKGFVLDAWLGNHDVIGTGKDNIILVGDKAHRIDAGGATIWRAQGADKTFVAKVSEFEGMRDPSRQAGRVFGTLKPDEVKQQLQDFATNYDKNRATVERIIDDAPLSPKVKERIKTGLNDRATWLKAEARGEPPPLTDDEFNAFASERQKSLPASISSDLQGYSGQGMYARINAPLRENAGKLGRGGLRPLEEPLRDIVRNIDAGVAASPAPRDMVVFRGVSGNRSTAAMGQLKPGDVYVDPGFGSTSYLPDIGSEYAKGFDVRPGVQLEISIPAGYPAMPIPSQFPKEREILLPRDGRYIVRSVEEQPGGRKVIKMAVRAPDPAPAALAPPEGFNLAALDSHEQKMFNADAQVVRGLPRPEQVDHKIARDIVYVVKPSELADVGLTGPRGEIPAWAPPEGGYRPVEIGVTKDGKYVVLSGNESLLAAAGAGDRPVPASFWPRLGKPKPEQLGAISDDIRSAIRPGGTAPTDTLTGQFRATQEGLAAGKSLNELGAPARAEYAAAKAERTAAASDHFRVKANAENYAGSQMGSTERDAFFANLARPKTRDAYVAANIGRAMREEGGHAAALAKVEREWTDLGGAKAEPPARTQHPRALTEAPPGLPPLPVSAASEAAVPKRMTLNSIDDFESFFGKDWSKAAPADWMAEAKAMGGQQFGHGRDVAKTIVDGSMKDAMRGVVEEDAIAAALRKHNGKNVDIGTDLATAAKVIGDRESAMADLVDLLGADAPVSAVENAKAYRAAIQQQAEKSGASAARAASDFDAKGGQQTLVDSDIAKTLRAYESKSEAGAQKATVSMAKGEAKGVDLSTEAKKRIALLETERTKPGLELSEIKAFDKQIADLRAGGRVIEIAKPRGALSIAADVGTALEVLHALGVHTPDLSAIPVIGPILSMYLKARAVVGIMGRKGGSIGRTTEGVVAAKAAAVRDRVSRATAAMLDIGAKAARRAQPIAGPVGALAYRLFPGDGDVKSKDPRVLYDARMDELARAQQPGAVDQAVSDRVRTSDPELQSALTAQTQRGIDFLASKAPQKPMLLPMVPGDGTWHPSKAALETWSRYVAAVHDPAGVLEDLANGHVTSEGAETLRVVYPQLFAEAQRRLIEHAADYTRTLPYARRISLSIMFRVPVDGSMTPQHIQYLQPPPQSPAGPAPGPAPGVGGAPALTAPLNLGQQTMTPYDRRAGA